MDNQYDKYDNQYDSNGIYYNVTDGTVADENYDLALYLASSLILLSFFQSSFFLCKRCCDDYSKQRVLHKFTSTVNTDTIDNLLNECSICIEQFQVNEKILTLPCSHIYHKSCLQKWLINNQNCPLCREDIIS